MAHWPTLSSLVSMRTPYHLQHYFLPPSLAIEHDDVFIVDAAGLHLTAVLQVGKPALQAAPPDAAYLPLRVVVSQRPSPRPRLKYTCLSGTHRRRLPVDSFTRNNANSDAISVIGPFTHSTYNGSCISYAIFQGGRLFSPSTNILRTESRISVRLERTIDVGTSLCHVTRQYSIQSSQQ